MLLIRSVNEDDLEGLYQLSHLDVFINLPRDRSLLKKKIGSSIQAFTNPSPKKDENYYIFVLEDIKAKKIIGVSMIHGQHGTDEQPHYFFKVFKDEKYSNTINTGFIHGALQLDFECNGYTEVGGLVLNPEYRNSGMKLGKQLSFSRFMYMALHKEEFTEVIHTELMPPLNKEGNPPLWEAIGRNFTNMQYDEADRLSRVNKEFILSLFPMEKIYESMLPIEARNAIGKVGPKTEPARKMMEKIGFKYMNEVDPFDGGPHYRCPLKNLAPVKECIERDFLFEPINSENGKLYLVLISYKSSFQAMAFYGRVENNNLILDKSAKAFLNKQSKGYSIPL